jgi:hypothetical protein
MVRATALACIASLLCAAPALAAEQFDLLCAGQVRKDVPGRWAPYTKTYRIDLAAGRWCLGNCSVVSPIFAVTASKIVLQEPTDSSKSADGSALTHEIDRTSGAVTNYSYRPPLFAGGSVWWWEERGVCEARPFSGMPAAKF